MSMPPDMMQQQMGAGPDEPSGPQQAQQQPASGELTERDQEQGYEIAKNAHQSLQAMGAERVIERVRQSGDPIEGIGELAGELASAIVQAGAAHAGTPSSMGVAFGIGLIVSDVAEEAASAGALDISGDEDAQGIAQAAYAVALEHYSELALAHRGMSQERRESGVAAEGQPGSAGPPQGTAGPAGPMGGGGAPPGPGAGLLGELM